MRSRFYSETDLAVGIGLLGAAGMVVVLLRGGVLHSGGASLATDLYCTSLTIMCTFPDASDMRMMGQNWSFSSTLTLSRLQRPRWPEDWGNALQIYWFSPYSRWVPDSQDF